MTILRSLICVILAGGLFGCAQNQHMPLIFAQSQTVGISIGGTTADQGVEFTLGYKDKNVAIVPIAIPDKDGNLGSVGSTSGVGFDDSYSVLGQFELSTSTNTTGNVGLGKFFATGAAAKALADGFACKLAADTSCFPSVDE